MFWLFWMYLVLFATGYTVRDVLPVLCLLCLLPYYHDNWKNSTLRRFPAWGLFIFFLLTALWGVLLSQNVPASLLHVGRVLNKAFILPFIAMECVRDETDLRRLLWALVIATWWQGCDGIWQSLMGFDVIHGTPLIAGRLTGSLNDYRVGNYMALMLIPSASVWFMLRDRHSRRASLALLALLLGPGLYLLYFSYTRNGYFTVIVGGALWMLVSGRRIYGKPLTFIGTALICVSLLVPQRLGLDVIVRDGRWDLWRFAWAVFEHFPLTGVGFGQYNAAFRHLGYVPTQDPITISHPHSIYLQLLCESGVVGFALAMVFLVGMLVWGWMRVRGPLLDEVQRAQQGVTSPYYRMTALLWCAWGAYLASGIVGHDFYRDWWQALVMQHLGIMIGALVNGPVNSLTRGP